MKEIYRRNKIIRKLYKQRHTKQKPCIEAVTKFKTMFDFETNNSYNNVLIEFARDSDRLAYEKVVKAHNLEMEKAYLKINEYKDVIDKLQDKLNYYIIREKESFMPENEIIEYYLADIVNITFCYKDKEKDLMRKVLMELVNVIKLKVNK